MLICRILVDAKKPWAVRFPRRVPSHSSRRRSMVRAKKNKKMAAVATPTDLKRLAFVESAAVSSYEYVTGSAYFAKACGYYSNAKETNALKVRRPPTAVERRAFGPRALGSCRGHRGSGAGSCPDPFVDANIEPRYAPPRAPRRAHPRAKTRISPA